MSQTLTDKTQVRAPIAVLVSIALSLISAGTVYGLMQARINEGESRDLRMERRIERLESDTVSIKMLLERIDERTAEIVRRLERK